MNRKKITDVRVPTSRAAGYAVMKMCEEFSKNSVNLELIIPNRKDSDFLGDPFDYYRLSKNFKIKKVWSTDFLGSSMFFGKVFYIFDLFSFLLSLKISTTIKNEDIIYTRDYFVPLVFSKRYFVCLELHDVPKSKFIFNKGLKRADLIFALNKYVKDALVSLGVNQSKIHVIPSGVDVKSFDIDVSKENARTNLNLPKDKKIIVYTGHLYKWKGVETLAEAAKILKDHLFIFVGGVEPEISSFKKRHEEVKNMVLIPYLERSKIPFYLKAADVLVVPNSKSQLISSKYTSPLKLLEYMASNRPIVASDLPSLREVLSESNAAFSLPDDPKSLSSSIEKILNDDNLSGKISSQAKKDVSLYDWSIRAKKILDVIKTNVK